MNQVYRVIGLMSGTSLDGVDIAFCEFRFEKKWSFSLIKAETISYSKEWKNRLNDIFSAGAEAISSLDAAYGNYLGELVREFIKKNDVDVDFISSHGHTIFHQPHRGFTKQIGNGANISAITGCDVICDFRTTDVALGGQGAPLVPAGDRHLFSEYDYCLNLGGIANISYEENGECKAFDICACNLVLNHLSMKEGKPYDENGSKASKGQINIELLKKLNALDYYRKSFPKSLGREDVDNKIIPLFSESSLPVKDLLATFCEHAASQIASVIVSGKSVLVTGGGTFNAYLIERLKMKTSSQIIIPEKNIIDFKEAIVFAFLGVLRIRGEANCLKSVTGARIDSSGGAFYKNIQKK